MKKDLQEILTRLRKLLPFITQKYQINSIEVFGSYIRNQQNSKSDLDVLVTFSKTPGLIKFLELKNYLSDQLQVNVDLVMKDSLKPRISPYILNETISL
jgi:predicted nucleotidyltransferase